MTKENKQFTELSDEDLKQVNGGFLSSTGLIACDMLNCSKLGKKTNSQTCECE